MTIHRTLAAGLLGLTVAAQSPGARALSEIDRANMAAANGPVVLEVDPDRAQFRGRSLGVVVPGPGERVIRAVPVPHVMNGGGFGLTGNDYYSDATTEGRLNAHRRTHDYILAPALRAKLP